MTSSPTFVARFVDGEVVRMTTYHDDETLDLERGVRLARWAYLSRKKQEPLVIESASFERDGESLATYSAEQLAEERCADPNSARLDRAANGNGADHEPSPENAEASDRWIESDSL